MTSSAKIQGIRQRQKCLNGRFQSIFIVFYDHLLFTVYNYIIHLQSAKYQSVINGHIFTTQQAKTCECQIKTMTDSIFHMYTK